MDRKNRIGSFVRVFAIACGLLLMAACTDSPAARGESGQLTPQASGQFSSGSLDTGSILGDFTVVGHGNVEKSEHEVQMKVDGVLWYVCVNKGGNEAPGQFAFKLGDDSLLSPEDPARHNGRYVTNTLKVDPQPDETACTEDLNKNWRLKKYSDLDGTYANPDDAITYLQPIWVFAFLYALPHTYDVDGNQTTEPVDTLVWDCSDSPDPTYPLEEYTAELTGPDGMCADPEF